MSASTGLALDATLPCGTDVADLLDDVIENRPTSPHAQRCLDCQTVTRTLGGRWRTVRAAARAPVPEPAGLRARLVAALHADGTGDPLRVDGERGTLRLGPRVVTQLARRAARQVTVVRPGAVRYTEGRLSIEVAVRYGADIDAAAGAVRDRIARELADQLGIAAPGVDISVTDVFVAGGA